MSFGKIYSTPGNSRSLGIRAVAKANKLDIEYVDAESHKGRPEYLKLNPLNRVPSFEGADGYTLSECMAIIIYLASQNEKTTLLGKTKQDYASIVRWTSFFNTEVLPHLGGWFRPLLGKDPYNKKSVEDHHTGFVATLNVLETHLLVNTFFVGERLTVADLFGAGIIARAAGVFFDDKNRAAFPCVTRWYETITNQPVWTEANESVTYAKEVLKNVAPAKTDAPKKAPAAPKAAPVAAAAAAAAGAAGEEEEDKPAPKPKHPLESLPKPTLVLDDWKRKYSNEDTREVALPWFWEQYKPEEYSLWQIDYKYNDELTMTFMSSNLVGGFFARLEASRKFIFGAASVYGKTNDSIIKGAFVIRGQEALPAFDVAPDYESYTFTKLDPSKEADKEFVNDQWAWDKPIVVDGKTYEWADGKVFK